MPIPRRAIRGHQMIEHNHLGYWIGVWGGENWAQQAFLKPSYFGMLNAYKKCINHVPFCVKNNSKPNFFLKHHQIRFQPSLSKNNGPVALNLSNWFAPATYSSIRRIPLIFSRNLWPKNGHRVAAWREQLSRVVVGEKTAFAKNQLTSVLIFGNLLASLMGFKVESFEEVE